MEPLLGHKHIYITRHMPVTEPIRYVTGNSADAEGPRDAPQIRNIALEKACNRSVQLLILD